MRFRRSFPEGIPMKKAERLEEIVNVFNPYPLDQNSFDEFYVNTYTARGTNAIEKVMLNLRYSRNPYMKILFMGHRGSGKSTELYLLKKEMESAYEVVNFFVEEEVDPVNLSYIDFIFAIMSQLIKYVDSHADSIKVSDKAIDGLYQYWYHERIIETVDYDNENLETGFKAKLSFLKAITVNGSGIMKTGSETKRIIRSKMEPKVSYLIQLMNDVIDSVNQQLCGKKLLFIVEDLDKLDINESEEIFIKHRKVVCALKVNMILSFPIFLLYDRQFSLIKDDFDSYQLLSMIKIAGADKKEYRTGIDTIIKIVEKRVDLRLISEEALLFMIRKSGGALRDLFQMIREAAFEALVQGRRTVTEDDARKAYVILKSEYERAIRSETDLQKIKQIYYDPKPSETDEILMRLLLRGVVLEYNGTRWCGIHPAIVDFLKEKGELPD